MTSYKRGEEPWILLEELRAGMIFVDASKPFSARTVILKVYYQSCEIWLCTIPGKPRRRKSLDFFWDPMTPHKKFRRTGFYLDDTIPGNTKQNWQKVPRA